MIFDQSYNFGKNLYNKLLDEMPDGKPICIKEDIGLIAQMICNTKGDHLEIGTAYGGTLFAALKSMEYCGRKGLVYSIDPFGEDRRDTVHKAVEKEFWNNVRHFGYEDRIRQIKEFTGPNYEFPIKGRRFATALIDGDHSYEYVLNDWNNVKNIVACYVMFHDYKQYDSIKQVVDEHAQHEKNWIIVAKEGWSAVLENTTWK